LRARPRRSTKIDFRRGTDGSGRIIVQLSSARVTPDLKQEGGKLVINFAKTAVPDSLLRRLDVVDFATPVSTSTQCASATRLVC